MGAMADFRVAVIDEVDDELVSDIRSLLPQLSSAVVDRGVVERLVAAPELTLFAARVGGTVVGLVTLAALPQLTGVRGHIEDVVVDEAFRGQGIARALLEAAIARAWELGARTLDLTSRPHRASAHRLYESLGFERRETDVMRLVPAA